MKCEIPLRLLLGCILFSRSVLCGNLRRLDQTDPEDLKEKGAIIEIHPDESIEDDQDRQLLGANEMIDVVMLLDGSASIEFSDWELQKQGLIAAIEDENVVPRTGKVGLTIIQYAATEKMELPHTRVTSKAVAKAIVEKIKNMQRLGGGTHPGDAVIAATNYKDTKYRRKARQIFCLATDEVGRIDWRHETGECTQASKGV